jgi:hypothetical protein
VDAISCGAGVVSRDDENALLVGGLASQRDDLPTRPLVKVSGRLIRYQNLWAVDKRAAANEINGETERVRPA